MKNKIEIISEIANAHQGNPDLAIEIAKSAINSNTNAVKFQMYTADDLLSKSHDRYNHFKNLSFSKNEWKKIIYEISKLKVKIYLDIFGLESLLISSEFSIDGYKVHFSDLSNIPLLIELARLNKKIFIGTGGANIFEIQKAVNTIVDYSTTSPSIVLLHGFQAYPTNIYDTNLNRLGFFYNVFGNQVEYGISDHIAGDSEFATIVPLLAIPFGIQYIEKHITINREERGVDYYSSIEPKIFKKFVEMVRAAELTIGSSSINYSSAELKYRKTVKKKWLTNKAITKGQLIRENDIVLKREDSNIDTLEYNVIINRKITKNILKGKLITNNYFDHKILAVVVARSSSNRLPDKATLPINNEPSLSHLFNRLVVSLEKGYLNKIAFCTTQLQEDDKLIDIAKRFPVSTYRGDVENVLKRIMQAVNDNPEYDLILRITGDDILIDPFYVNKSVNYHIENNLDYTSAKSLPSGTEVEVINSSVLNMISKYSEDPEGTEYLTNYIIDNKAIFNIGSLPVPDNHKKDYRLTLDTKEDYKLINDLCTWLSKLGKKYDYTIDDINSYFNNHPLAEDINRQIVQKVIPRKFSTKLIPR